MGTQAPTAAPDVSRTFLDAVLARASDVEVLHDLIGACYAVAGPALTLAENHVLARQGYDAWAECREDHAGTIEVAKSWRQDESRPTENP